MLQAIKLPRAIPVEDLPADGDALIARLGAGPTNDSDGVAERVGGIAYDLAAYRDLSSPACPRVCRAEVTERWGPPEADPHLVGEAFMLSAFRLGETVIGLQPARGYNIDPSATYHDPDLVPPHGYLAFYAWLRREAGVQAVIHMGKHGNLEWLPGKALALSAACYPEAVLGPLPHLYPSSSTTRARAPRPSAVPRR